jgi:hypothetical protein
MGIFYPIIGAIVGFLAGRWLIRMIGLGYSDIHVGRVGDQPVYEKRDSCLSGIFALAGLVVGGLAGMALWVMNLTQN